MKFLEALEVMFLWGALLCALLLLVLAWVESAWFGGIATLFVCIVGAAFLGDVRRGWKP